MPKVSIIIPIYNTAPYICKCLDSVLKQTLKDIEIICINDGCTDGTAEILNEYSLADKRIKVVAHNNLGPGVSRNEGISKAEGEYLIFVDGDDWIEPELCDECYKKAKQYSVPLISFNAYQVSKNSKKKLDYFGITDREVCWKDISERVFESAFHSWHFFYKKSFLVENNILFPSLSLCEDVPFVLKVLLSVPHMYVLNKCYYNYYQRGDSITSNISLRAFDIFDVIGHCEQVLRELEKNENSLMEKFSCWKIKHLSLFGSKLKEPLKSMFLYKISNVCSPNEMLQISFEQGRKKYKVNLFGLFSVFRYYECSEGVVLKLFNLLPIFRIARNTNVKKFYLFGFLIGSIEQ